MNPLRLASVLANPAAGLAAMQRGNGHCYIESSSSFCFLEPDAGGYINRRPCPPVRPTTQRARASDAPGEIHNVRSQAVTSRARRRRAAQGRALSLAAARGLQLPKTVPEN